MLCPCNATIPFDACCGPYLRGEKPTPTAEALMRSRYSAFATGNMAYLSATQTSADPITAPDVTWSGLEILSVERGTASDHDGYVEFLARYDHTEVMHERAYFKKINGRWVYWV